MFSNEGLTAVLIHQLTWKNIVGMKQLSSMTAYSATEVTLNQRFKGSNPVTLGPILKGSLNVAQLNTLLDCF